MSFLTMATIARRRKAGIKGISGKEAEEKTEKKKRPIKARKKILIAAGLLCVSVLALAMLYFIGSNHRAGKRGGRAGEGVIRNDSRGPESIGPCSRIDRSWERLYAEALSDPSSHEYFRLLAASLSRIAQSALASALTHHHAGVLSKDGGQGSIPHGEKPEAGSGEAGTGDMMMSVDFTLSTAVLRSLWEKLSGMHEIRDQAKLIGHIVMPEAVRLQQVASGLGITRACEVGFNEGHSAAALLLSSRTLKVISIEVSEDEHVSRAAALLSSMFPGRLEVIRHNSSLALPMLAERSVGCDLIRIDGSHVGEMPWLDLLNSKLVASGPRILWMDDVGCANWNCREPTAAWERAKYDGLVDEAECSVSQDTDSHGYCIATFAAR